MGLKKSPTEKFVQWFITIAVIAIAAVLIKNYMTVIDVTGLANASKTTIESTLKKTLVENPRMVNKIYRYTDDELTVEGGTDDGVALLYLNNERCGFHIDNRKYSMFGIKMGMSELDVDDELTYSYDQTYVVLDDLYDQGTSRGVFYCNQDKNDCLIIVYNDMTGRVLALTYYSDMKKVTENLSF